MHTAIWSFTPKKAGYMDTQLSPANAKNEKYIYTLDFDNI